MSEENKSKENGFFKKVIISIKDFDKYQEFAVEGFKKSFKYLLMLILIFAVAISIFFTSKFATFIQDNINFLKNDISEVEYKDSTLLVNSGEQIIKKSDYIYNALIINTSLSGEEVQNYGDILNDYDTAVLLLKDKMILKTAMLGNDLEYNYSDIAKSYGITEFNKDTMLGFISNLNMPSIYLIFFFTMTVYMFMIYLVSTLIDVFMLAVLGFLVARIIGIKIKFKATFNMGIHALTLPIILNLIYIAINLFTGYTVKYFNWMYTTISYIYMIVAILMIRMDLISKQKELTKLHEEQLKIREELQRQEEEKQKEEENNPKDDNNAPEEKKKRKKDDNDNKENDGLAPQE